MTTGLRYVPAPELERIRRLDVDPYERCAAFADACRINVLYMIARAGSGHVGTSLSCLDVISWLHLEVLGPEDRYFSSKGHDAPALYAVLIALGRLDFDLLHRLRRLGGLPGHPDVAVTPAVHASTGSLGMGISKAKGFALSGRLTGRRGRTFVLTGDGELQEGQFWESLRSAATLGLEEITAIVDHNRLQSDTWVEEVGDLGDLEAKTAAFGWAVGRCDGHDPAAIDDALTALDEAGAGRPRLLVADTVKGAGAAVFEPHDLPHGTGALYGHHSGAPTAEECASAFEEISERLGARLAAARAHAPELAEADAPARAAASRPQRLVAAYGEALAKAADADPRLVVLDADLVKDCGLVAFRARHPERFFEFGIAEQDMVSAAGTMALTGLVPVVHSFACFLAARADEQIYNNTTQGGRVVYVGSLAGLLPGGPGHSHQSVRDIAILGSMPGMALLEPATEREVAPALDWALREAQGPVYVRLVSVPWEVPFPDAARETFVPGRGTSLREGGDALLVAAGPVMLSQAWVAAEQLAGEGMAVGVAALPWLRDVDGAWLAETAAGAPVFCLDNHVVAGGQGDAVLAALAERGAGPVHRLGVRDVPACGRDDEVLAAHGLDAATVAERVAAGVRTAA